MRQVIKLGEIADIWLCIFPSEEPSGPQLGATKAELLVRVHKCCWICYASTYNR